MRIDAIQKYVSLIASFLGGSVDASTFEPLFLGMFKNEGVIFPPIVFNVLDRLFADVDSYCADPAIRGKEDLDENQLRDRCGTALLDLQRYCE